MRLRQPLVAATLVALVAAGAAPAQAAPGRAHERGRCRAGHVSMTFDDGPAPAVTSRLLRILKARHVPAVFFMNGTKVAAAPRVARLVERSGFLVANHGYDHADMTGLSETAIESTIRRTDVELRHAGVHPVPLVRPPYGAVDADVYTAARRTHHAVVLWSVDPRDWDYRSTDAIVASVLAQLHPHSDNVVLMHDGVVNSPRSVDAVPRIIATARRRGYCFTALDDRGAPGFPVPAVTLSVDPADRRVREGGSLRATLTLATPAGRDTSVRLSVVAVTGATGDVHDDLRHTSQLVRVPSGSTSVRVTVPVIRDGLDEETERFDLGLTDAEGLQVSGQAVEVAVQDRDRPPRVAGEPASVAEPAAGTAQVPVVFRLSAPSGRDIRLAYRTVPGTADGSDYTSTSGAVTIPAGELTAEVVVTVNADLEVEGPETFAVHLDAADHARVRVADAVVTIS